MKINIPANTKTVILNIVSNEMIELNKAVNDAKVKLGLSNSELSKLIGHSRNYISESLRVGVSTDKQKEIQAKIEKAVEVELIRRGMAGSKCQIVPVSDMVSKAYHDQEINKYQKELTEVHNELKEIFNDGSVKDFQINASTKEIEEQKQNVRMLNMEVEQLKVDCKELENDLAIANRDKNFMKRKLSRKNEIINYGCPFILLLWFIVVIKWWV